MSPRWMMDPEFEIDGFEYYNSEDEEDDLEDDLEELDDLDTGIIYIL
jgi:hypothetical protein